MTMYNRHVPILFFFVFFIFPTRGAFAQEYFNNKNLQVLFYNVENLFDPFDDTLTADDEFTPAGHKHWTWNRFNKKINGLYKVIAATGNWSPPGIIGFCEIENKWVLDRLFHETPLVKYQYRIIHQDSPDKRGIDVALAYREKYFRKLSTRFITVSSSRFDGYATRDILYVKGIAGVSDTLHLFINHWPSKYGGAAATEKYRVMAANILKKTSDSILHENPGAKIIFMGDFNDTPTSLPLTIISNPYNKHTPVASTKLYNLAYPYQGIDKGTHKYKAAWNMIDQFIVSGNLLNSQKGYKVHSNTMKIFIPDYLLEKDERYLGVKPMRTYRGYHYHGGYSDHLPVLLELEYPGE
jgi:endonuclease/exonuclease/phosphatase family metal-dependent hydrolase